MNTKCFLIILGFYCALGTSTPAPCPPGSFGASTGLNLVSQCTPCNAGFYCEASGLNTNEGRSRMERVSYIQRPLNVIWDKHTEKRLLSIKTVSKHVGRRCHNVDI